MKKKILFIVEAMGGGVFTYMVDLSNELVKKYDVYIAYAVRPQTPKNYKSFFEDSIHMIEVKNFGRSLNPIRDLKTFFEIRKIANKIKPDIIHLHSSKAGAIGRFAFNGKVIPLFYTPHGYSFLMQNQRKLTRMVYRVIEKICSIRSCITIGCSEGEYKEALKLSSKATYVSNGVNIKELEKLIGVEEGQPDVPFTVCTLGRVCHQKNPQLFNSLAEKLPNVKFVWIGDGELRDKLTAPNIEVTGWVERKDALKHLITAHTFILTSLWEGLPISLLEAMYMKKICIVTNVIGNRDVIQDGYNGYICDTAEEFAETIIKIQNQNQIEIIKCAFDSIVNKYNTKTMAEKYVEIYNQALMDKGEKR